jgi:uncharacterized membrane protein
MMEDRSTFLKRVSDAYLPPALVEVLSGSVFFKVNNADINGWTIVHMISGILTAFLLTQNIRFAISIHTLWELFQAIAGDNSYDLESMTDILFDTTAFYIGFMMICYGT